MNTDIEGITSGNAPAVDRPVLRYYGGKFRLAPWIISHFPEHTCYVEPYGGAAGCLLRKEPSPLEVYNDLDGDVVNFFRVLRDRPTELSRMLRHTPFARAEFDLSYERVADPEGLDVDRDLEAARRFFVMAWQGYGGPRKSRVTGWKRQACIWDDSRAKQVTEWEKAKQVMAAARRFRQIQIECDDALRIIQRFDTPQTLFYCDPPYPASTRNISWCKRAYSIEMAGDQHLHLANLLGRIQGMAIVSSYPNPSYEELYAGWARKEKKSQTMSQGLGIEMIYLSPRLTERLDETA